MKTCPFCNAGLADNASFCPHCTASLIERTDVAPYRTLTARKILVFILVLLSLSAVLFFALRYGSAAPESPDASQSPRSPDPSVTETAAGVHSTDTSAPVPVTGKTDVTQIPPTADTTDVTDITTDITQIPETPSSDSQPLETDILPPDLPSESETQSEIRTSQNSETASGSEDTGTPEEVPDSGTYSYKGILWYYQTPTDKTEYPYTFYNYELDEVAIITGVDCLRSDGVYYVPETIYGKHVVMLRPNQDTGARIPFTSSTFKSNVKVIYFPPEVTAISSILLKGTSVTDIYIAGEYFFLNGFPDKGTLTVHCSVTCENTTKYLPMKDLCPSYSTDTFTCVWEEWDGSTLYPQ